LRSGAGLLSENGGALAAVSGMKTTSAIGEPVSVPGMAVVAEGDLPTGEHWVVRAGGTAEDYCTMLETVHPDGHRDEGGMGGPPLYPGHSLNTYTGGMTGGLRRILAGTAPQVRSLRMELASGEVREHQPVGSDTARGLNFFAALLPWTVSVSSLIALDADGQILEQ
jgi:hypothetical protein